MSNKDAEIADLQGKLEIMENDCSDANKAIGELTRSCRDLGYSLYMERNLSKHPKYNAIHESMGDLTRIESLSVLKERCKPYLDEMKTYVPKSDRQLVSLKEEIQDARNDLFEAKEKVKTLSEERDQAIKMGLDNASRVYLERKITGNPYQAEIRNQFEMVQVKTKANVDKLVEHYRNIRRNESGDFEKIRQRLKGNPHGHMVEDNLRETVKIGKEKFQVLEGHTFDMSEVKRLAGM